MSKFDQSLVQMALKAFDVSRESLLDEYFELLRFKSVSSEKEYKAEVDRCSEWVKGRLEAAGLQTEIWRGDGHPVVFAEYRASDPTAPTVLLYNHYDVQPVDPLELWKSPPFEPRLDGDIVYARGAADNKGQLFYVLAAVRWMLAEFGELPLNVKLVVEGEEEIGSPSLSKLFSRYKERLKADSLLIVDSGSHSPDVPAITLGCRGIVTMTVTLTGSKGDLHSGLTGGAVYNPNRALAEILAQLYDADGRVAIPGFYDHVQEPSADERGALLLSLSDEQLEQLFSAKVTGGEKGFGALERTWLRPTLEINGVGGGYIGDGFKTVIPAKSVIKISCRVVPNQRPEEIGLLVKDFIESIIPQGITGSVQIHPGSGAPVRSRADSHTATALADALNQLSSNPAVFTLSGGSIPIVEELARAAEAEVVMMGFGLPDDDIHAPNEKFSVSRLQQGFAAIVETLRNLRVPER
jgi:acetylornithine deacetylase/succinyl-diaminopimelate desuccinylase-like protein